MPYKDKNSPEAKASAARRRKTYYEKNKDKEVIYNVPDEKRCSKCKKIKKKEEFYGRKNRPEGLTAWCIECLIEYSHTYKERNKINRRLRSFGIKHDEYSEMFSRQDGRCAICGKTEEEIQQKSLCVDHCHETGKIRGLLCHDCNVGLGRFKDSKENLANAIKYLTI